MFQPRPHIVERTEYKNLHTAEGPMLRVLNEFINTAIDSFPDATGKKLLDVGCGRQPFRKQIEAKGFHYTGLDVNQNPEGTVDVLCAIDESLPSSLQQQSFDVIVCFEVLEHVAKWDDAFSNFSSLMKPGAQLILTAPHFFYLHEVPYDFWRPTIYAFEYFGNKHGLKTKQLIKGGTGWDVLSTLISTSSVYAQKRTLINRLKGFAIRKFLRWMNNGILSGSTRDDLAIDGPFYLSNLIVLEK